MLDLYFWSVIVFFLILIALIYKDRKNLEFHKILVIKRSRKGRNLINRVADFSPGLWNVISLLFTILALSVMVYGTYLILVSTQLVISGVFEQPAIQIILPIPQQQPINGLGFIGVPFWFWILVVPFVMFPHEFSHGVVSRINDIRINSVGLIQILIFSGAFVEPNESDLKKASLMSRLKVFSAGSMTNITISIILILLARNLLWPLIMPTGILITEVVDGSGADLAGLKPGMILQEINGTKVNVDYTGFTSSYTYLLINNYNLTKENVGGLATTMVVSGILQNYSPNQTVEITADGDAFSLTFSGRPENSTIPYMGLSAEGVRGSDFTLNFLFPLVWWLTTLSYFVSVFNLLPIYPLDGGLIIGSIAEKYSPKHSKNITNLISLLLIGLLIFNFFGPSFIKVFS